MSIFKRKPDIAKMAARNDAEGLLRELDAKDIEFQIQAFMALKKLNNPDHKKVLDAKADRWAQQADQDVASWKALEQINDPRCVTVFLNQYTERGLLDSDIEEAGVVISNLASKDLNSAFIGFTKATTLQARNIMVAGLLPVAKADPVKFLGFASQIVPPSDLLIEVIGESGYSNAMSYLEGIETDDETLKKQIQQAITQIKKLNTRPEDVTLSESEIEYLKPFKENLQEKFIQVLPSFQQKVPDVVLELEKKGLMEFKAFDANGSILYNFTQLGKDVVLHHLP